MELSVISLEEVYATAIRSLGLDEQSVALDYPEAIAASLRRAASFLCPTTPRVLVDTVREVLTPVLPQPPERDDLMDLVDQLISTGDLLELTEMTTDRKARLLYLGPPSFVEKSAGRYLLTGIRPLGAPLVSGDFAIDCEGHTRTVTLDPDGAETRLRATGLHKITTAQWIGRPTVTTAAEYVGQIRQRLSVARAAGFVDGLTIIDPATRPTYYRGRWRTPAPGDTGDFVGRRPQAYGADLWCVVRLVDGLPDRLLDLPLDSFVAPARDDAWRLQTAIDAVNKVPLVYRTRKFPNTEPAEHIVDFFSPLPTWAERYLEFVGMSLDKSQGALFSYRVPASALAGITSLLTETLWMRTAIDGDE